MHTFDKSTNSINYISQSDKLSSCIEHLDFDNTYLDKLENSEKNNSVHYRLWELNEYAVVLGRSNKTNLEVNESFCHKNSISCFSRSSGGGTVLLGPGCLCYSLFLSTSHPHCNTIQGTNQYVMTLLKTALLPLNSTIEIQGYTDLCIKQIKFSGNAQRRKKKTLLFHGTILYNFDLSIINHALSHPSKEPSYRKQRNHLDFLCNFNHSKQDIIHNLTSTIQNIKSEYNLHFS